MLLFLDFHKVFVNGAMDLNFAGEEQIVSPRFKP